ncbi:MAG: outer membrane protein assembly factor BamA, partial [Myxococcales bacterium]|nr:outer membrane protein assembly factor BamA [Myxococcales bacterium]
PTEADLARGLVIDKVTIAGNERMPAEDIQEMLKNMRVGQTFTPEGLSEDVKELWRSLYFEDIQVDLTRKDAGVQLRILVRERPTIKEITFTGQSALDEDDLKEALSVEVKVGSVLSHSALRRGVQKLRDKYAEEGFFLAEVEYEIKPQKENEVKVEFKVIEHEQVTIRRITFVGNHSIPDDELRDLMITGQTSFFDFGTGASFRADAFERDVLVINAIYYDRGFLNVQVATPRVMITPDRTGIEITISINEGPRFKIRSLAVFERDADGKEVEPIGGRRALREKIRAKPGDFFNRAQLAKDIGTIQRMYRDEGYANVEVPLDNDVDPEKNEVDVRIVIRRKNLVKFGRIEIRGNTKTRDKVIRRELEIEEQKLFSESLLERSKRRVTQLGYFERVDVSTEQGDSDEFINVNIDVIEKPTGTFQIGAGFSSIESFIATAQIQQFNLFGNGQSFSLQAQISGLRQLIDFRFLEPYLFDSQFSGSISLYDRLNLYDQFSQNSLGGALSIGYPIIQPELRAALTYTLQNDEISTATTSTLFGTASAVSVYRRLPLANLFNDGITSSLKPSLTLDTRNNQIFPTEGVYLNASAELAANFIGSENQFIKYRANFRGYYPIIGSVIFRYNSEFGAVTSPDPTGVPIYARFFLGGIFDLRGFRLRTVGPRLPLREALDENAQPIQNGANIGGNLMYYQNVEIEFPIIEAVQIRGVVFTDLGNAWNLEGVYCDAAPASPDAVTDPCFDPEDIFQVRTSWGFGIRWISPLGPLRFEWGFPFSPLPYEEGSVFEFTIGNFF